MKIVHSFIFLLFVLTLGTTLSMAQDQDSTPDLLIVKPGDESATVENAAEFINRMTEILSLALPKTCGSTAVSGLITTRLSEARDLFSKRQPILVFSPVGFYLDLLQESDRPVVPIATIPRFGKEVEHYYLVALKKKNTSLSNLRKKTVRTVFDFDLEYLKKVVFPRDFQPGKDFHLEGSPNLADELFLLLEGGEFELDSLDEGLADALLFDEELKTFFENDDMVWPELEIIWKSEDLPREMIMTVGECWKDGDRDRLKKIIFDMKNIQIGAEILDLMNSSGFIRVNLSLLEKTRNRYFGQSQ